MDTVSPNNWWNDIVPRKKWLISTDSNNPTPHEQHDQQIIASLLTPTKLSSLHQLVDFGKTQTEYVTKSLYWYTQNIQDPLVNNETTPIPILHPGFGMNYYAMDPNNLVFYGDNNNPIPWGQFDYSSNTVSIKDIDKAESLSFFISGQFIEKDNIELSFEVNKSGADYIYMNTSIDTNTTDYCINQPIVMRTYSRSEIAANIELFKGVSFEFRIKRLKVRDLPFKSNGTMGITVVYRKEDLPT